VRVFIGGRADDRSVQIGKFDNLFRDQQNLFAFVYKNWFAERHSEEVHKNYLHQIRSGPL